MEIANDGESRLLLLRAHRERPRRRAAEQRDEVAAFHQQFLPCFEAEDSTAGDYYTAGFLRLSSRYRTGRTRYWFKCKNPDARAVRREAEEEWGKSGGA